MTWADIGRSHLAAAKQVAAEHPRSATSRAYYAAHVIVSDALLSAGYVPPAHKQTAPHDAQPSLITKHLSGLGRRTVRELRTTLRRLYERRIDGDYKRTVTVDMRLARDSLRDASAIFGLLGVTEV